MPIINTLSENLINQIAAGEVVERPASCVKELVENAIDAEARNIRIEVENGGKTYIKVADDGIGMDRKDAKLCFARHATSKISTQDDLSHISTMGFRGEALASIAAVSIIRLQTKKRGKLVGTLVECEGGRIKKHEECGTREGTQIEVKKLFYNTPARQKYLKTDTTEFHHILSFATGFSLSHPWISFKLVHNGKPIFDLPAGQSPLDRIRYVLGRDTADNVVPVFYGSVSVKIEGYVGNPSLARAVRDNQFLFVNRREIKNAAIAFAIKDCFKSVLPDGKFPVFVLNIEIDPSLVDCNVHPRKTEVRFVNQREIFQKVQDAVNASLQKHMLAPKITHAKTFAQRHASPSDVQNAIKFTEQLAASAPQKQRWRPAAYVPQEQREHQSLAREASVSIFPLAQVANSYIVAQDEEGLMLIDQHAAHERVIYERLLKEFSDKNSVSSQSLLLPANIELSHKDIHLLNENREVFNTLGFEIEDFSGNTVSVNAVPACLASCEDAAAAVSGLLDDIANLKKPSNLQSRIDRMLHFIACRSAVKFGQKLTHEEQVRLISDLEKTDRRFTCPHGRPTMIQLTFTELDKRFGRK